MDQSFDMVRSLSFSVCISHSTAQHSMHRLLLLELIFKVVFIFLALLLEILHCSPQRVDLLSSIAQLERQLLLCRHPGGLLRVAPWISGWCRPYGPFLCGKLYEQPSRYDDHEEVVGGRVEGEQQRAAAGDNNLASSQQQQNVVGSSGGGDWLVRAAGLLKG